jgi:hypothetical protein
MLGIPQVGFRSLFPDRLPRFFLRGAYFLPRRARRRPRRLRRLPPTPFAGRSQHTVLDD